MQRTRVNPERKTLIPRTPASVPGRNLGGSRPHGCRLLESDATTLAEALPAGQGEHLHSSTRQDLERQLHWDFSRVRVHRGAEASEYAAFFGAPAYAVGNQVVLGDEKQQGATDGAELLRHEAIHAMQQGQENVAWGSRPFSVSQAGDSSEREASVFSRIGLPSGHLVTPVEPRVAKAPPVSAQIIYNETELTARRREIWNLALNPPTSPDPKHKENKEDNRYHAIRCFNRIRYLASRQELPGSNNEEDYYTILENLLRKPKALTASGGVSPELRKEAINLEAEWVFAATPSNAEEALTQSLPRNRLPSGEEVQVLKRERWTATARIAGMFTIYLYRSKGEKEWYKRAHIHGRIQLQPARKEGEGADEDKRVIGQIRGIVQDIENIASRAGSGITFDLDVQSTRRTGVATFKINSSKWPDSGNPWGEAKTMVEELFHNVGLEDVYDYTVHATNDVYSIHERLELLYWQLTKYGSNDPKWRPDLPSITKGGAAPTDFDYCQVLAEFPGQFRRCMSERGVPAP